MRLNAIRIKSVMKDAELSKFLVQFIYTIVYLNEHYQIYFFLLSFCRQNVQFVICDQTVLPLKSQTLGLFMNTMFIMHYFFFDEPYLKRTLKIGFRAITVA